MGVASAEAPEREFKWDELQRQGRALAGSVLSPDSNSPFHQLKTEGRPGGLTATVLTIDRPQISAKRYSLTGQVRYEKVEGIGYLELWNHFPDGGQYFSRTLADQGPMMKLQGSSGWRPFVLPFDATGSPSPSPSRLVFNVVLPGGGTVYLGPLQLTEQAQHDSIANEFASVLGSVAGAVVGGCGALIGLLTALGRARRLVIVAATMLIALGVFAFTAGLLAFSSQPSSVSYPLLILGFVAAVIPLGVLPAIKKRYEAIELRAMRAHDIG